MKKFLRMSVAASAAALALAVPLAAHAATGLVVTTGTCSGSSTWMLTVKVDHPGTLEADVEVQTPAAGELWRSTFRDNGVVFAHGHKTTAADGSFSLTRFAVDQTGPDAIKVRSLNTVTGETCVAKATF